MENFVFIHKGSSPKFIYATVVNGFMQMPNNRPVFNSAAVEAAMLDRKMLSTLTWKQAIEKYSNLIVKAGVHEDYICIPEDEYKLNLYKTGEKTINFISRPLSNTFELGGKLPASIWAIAKPFGKHFTADELDEFDEFGAAAGWRYSKKAIDALVEAGYKVTIDGKDAVSNETKPVVSAPAQPAPVQTTPANVTPQFLGKTVDGYFLVQNRNVAFFRSEHAEAYLNSFPKAVIKYNLYCHLVAWGQTPTGTAVGLWSDGKTAILAYSESELPRLKRLHSSLAAQLLTADWRDCDKTEVVNWPADSHIQTREIIRYKARNSEGKMTEVLAAGQKYFVLELCSWSFDDVDQFTVVFKNKAEAERFYNEYRG